MSKRRNVYTGKKGRKRSLPFWRKGPGPAQTPKRKQKGQEERQVPIFDPLREADPKQNISTRIEKDYQITENKAYAYPPFVIVAAVIILIVITFLLLF